MAGISTGIGLLGQFASKGLPSQGKGGGSFSPLAASGLVGAGIAGGLNLLEGKREKEAEKRRRREENKRFRLITLLSLLNETAGRRQQALNLLSTRQFQAADSARNL